MNMQMVASSFVGQLLVVAIIALGYLVVAVSRMVRDWSEDFSAHRREKRIERLRKRLAQCSSGVGSITSTTGSGFQVGS